jgi:hypothetical protein
MSRAQLTSLLALAVLIWGAWLLVAGIPVGLEYLAPFSGTITIVFLVTIIFDRWIWKWGIFHGWLVPQPCLSGTWLVELQSSYSSPETGKPLAPFNAYLVIRQTFSLVSVRLHSRETNSKLLSGQIRQNDDGEWVLAGVYLDTPKIKVRDRSQIHYGAFELRICGNPVNAIEGHYWTDRETRGDIHSRGFRSEILSSFESADQEFSKATQ